ncbi:MAG: hypothetical protein VX309_00600, partial [Pseudomonadota bacterium]|nr:hypothetical protein [Pseudomonadota bacterium]
VNFTNVGTCKYLTSHQNNIQHKHSSFGRTCNLPAGEIHDPSPMARPKGYPQRLIEHRAGRERALGAWERFKGE